MLEVDDKEKPRRTKHEKLEIIEIEQDEIPQTKGVLKDESQINNKKYEPFEWSDDEQEAAKSDKRIAEYQEIGTIELLTQKGKQPERVVDDESQIKQKYNELEEFHSRNESVEHPSKTLTYDNEELPENFTTDGKRSQSFGEEEPQSNKKYQQVGKSEDDRASGKRSLKNDKLEIVENVPEYEKFAEPEDESQKNNVQEAFEWPNEDENEGKHRKNYEKTEIIQTIPERSKQPEQQRNENNFEEVQTANKHERIERSESITEDKKLKKSENEQPKSTPQKIQGKLEIILF